MIRVQRVYDHDVPRRGERRFLVDRVWPRGIARDALALDGWARDAAPSTELRTWFGHDPDRWDEFRRRYVAELESAPEPWQPLLAAAQEGDVVLLYGAKAPRNNAVALREFLERRLKEGAP